MCGGDVLKGLSLSQVNGTGVEGKQHSQVVGIIRSGGEETTLLVVDPETEIYFKRCRVTPALEHLTGTHTHVHTRSSKAVRGVCVYMTRRSSRSETLTSRCSSS